MEKVPAGAEQIERRLRQILRDEKDASVMAAELVQDSATPDLDDLLFSFLRPDYLHPKISMLACRLLIERDRDRDPAPLVNAIAGGAPEGYRDGIAGIAIPPLVASFEYGFSRLRRFDPIVKYDTLLSERGVNARINAAIGLGDTADPAALDPLAKALADRSPSVREQAANSIRRLRHAGVGDVLAVHPVRNQLIACLRDGRRRVRIAAARALGALGDLEPLREDRRQRGWRALRRRRDIDGVLRGRIPPLPKTWPGDDTT